MKAHNNSAILAAGLCLALTWLARSAHAQGGVPLWTNRYDGPAHGYDAPTSLAVSKDGIVFVTGYSYRTNNSSAGDYATLAYSNDGVPLWTNRFRGPGHVDDEAGPIGTDSEGNVIVSGGVIAGSPTNPYTAITTIKYSSAGSPLWTNDYSAGTNGAYGFALAVDRNDNAIVTGTTWNGNNGDYATVAYSSAGAALWTNRYNGPANNDDEAKAIAVDGNGNVYVTGFSAGTDTGNDFATVAYSITGAPLWTNRYNGPGNGDDQAAAIAVDAFGNVYITGWSPGVGGDKDFATVSYSSAGTPLWTNRYSGPGNGGDFAQALAVDSRHGNLIVTGPSGGQGIVTIACSTAGVPLWTNAYQNGGNAYAVAVDSAGNVFVTGESQGDILTLGYSNDGALLWTNLYNSPANGSDYGFAMAVDHDGNVFVTGQSRGGTAMDYAVIKYSSSVPPPPHLDLQRVNDQLVLSWTNSAFILQTAPALTDTFTNIPEAISPYTNSITAPQQFFRLAGTH